MAFSVFSVARSMCVFWPENHIYGPGEHGVDGRRETLMLHIFHRRHWCSDQLFLSFSSRERIGFLFICRSCLDDHLKHHQLNMLLSYCHEILLKLTNSLFLSWLLAVVPFTCRRRRATSGKRDKRRAVACLSWELYSFQSYFIVSNWWQVFHWFLFFCIFLCPTDRMLADIVLSADIIEQMFYAKLQAICSGKRYYIGVPSRVKLRFWAFRISWKNHLDKYCSHNDVVSGK